MSSGLSHLPLEARKGPRAGSSGFLPSLGLSGEVQKELMNLSPGVGPGSVLSTVLVGCRSSTSKTGHKPGLGG